MKYSLPAFLQGRCTVDVYRNWLLVKAKSLHLRDLKLGRAYAAKGTWTLYREAIHEAVLAGGERDPFTGVALSWELIGTWDDKRAHDIGQEYFREFYLLPSVDHTDPALFEFEICSLLVNSCKNQLSAVEFVALCRKITAHRSEKPGAERSCGGGPIKYEVPPFLQGIVTHKFYSHWLLKKAGRLWEIDKQEKRPFVAQASQGMYKAKLQAAILETGLCDPYTGDALRWDLIGTWDDTKSHDPAMKKEYLLLPTADHTDPDKLDFEICSWLINMCKSHLNREDFLGLCGTVAGKQDTERGKILR
jgi:hypothetical protein